uniref:Uncharacterized protein n=1 Tax=Hucho hucho TaxID=62062 RepID=A0A4W5QQG8_9TELE
MWSAGSSESRSKSAGSSASGFNPVEAGPLWSGEVRERLKEVNLPLARNLIPPRGCPQPQWLRVPGPCQPFSEPEDLAGTDCTDVAACLTVRFYRNNRYISHYINYGRHEGNEFHYNNSLQTLSVSYSVLEYTHPLTVVHYHCSPNRSTSFALHFDGNIPLQIWVESPCACPNACSLGDVGPGTIFLIILSLSATAYFILGKYSVSTCRYRLVIAGALLYYRVPSFEPLLTSPLCFPLLCAPFYRVLCSAAIQDRQWSADRSRGKSVVHALLHVH